VGVGVGLVLGCLWVWVVFCDWCGFLSDVALFSVSAFDSGDWAGFGFCVVFLAVVLILAIKYKQRSLYCGLLRIEGYREFYIEKRYITFI